MKKVKLITILSLFAIALVSIFSMSVLNASANGSHPSHTSHVAHTAHTAHSNHNKPVQCGAIAHRLGSTHQLGCVTPTSGVAMRPLSGSPTTSTPTSRCGAIGHVIGSSQQIGCVQTPRPQFGVIEWTPTQAAQSPIYNLPSSFTLSYECDGGTLTLSIVDTTGLVSIGGAIMKQTFVCDNQLHTLPRFDMSYEYGKAGIAVDRIQLAVDRVAIIQIGE